MDKSITKQTELEFNGNITLNKLNIYTGRLNTIFPLISTGSNTFQIVASLIYNSNSLKSDFGFKKIGFEKGWKLNIEQHLFPYNESYNLSEFNLGDYVYIDSNWTIHRFIKYKEKGLYGSEEAVYYDPKNPGLRLKIYDTKYPEIYDGSYNLIRFNHNGKIIEIVSCVNQNIIKKIEYNDMDQIESIYDLRKPNQKIEFFYNDQNQLIKASSPYDMVKLSYNANKLEKITNILENQRQDKVKFIYNDKQKLETIIELENLNAITFEYDETPNPKVIKIIEGQAKEEYNLSDDASYVSKTKYLGDNTYVTNDKKAMDSTYLVMPTEYIRNTTLFNYKSFCTEVTNDKNITLRYYFNMDTTTSTVTEYLENDNDYNNFTESKLNGYKVSTNGTSRHSINRCSFTPVQAINLPNNIKGKYQLYDVGNLLSTLRNINYLGIQDFVLSFFVRAKEDITTKIKAELALDKEDISDTKYSGGYTYIKPMPAGSIQYVQIPVNFLISKFKIRNMYILFTDNTSIEIGDAKFSIGNINNPMFIDKIKIDTVDTFRYTENNTEIIVPKSDDFFITESDVIETYKSLFYKKINNQQYFDLVYCGGTKVKPVTSFGLDYSDIDKRVHTMEITISDTKGTTNLTTKKRTITGYEKYIALEKEINFLKTSNNNYAYCITTTTYDETDNQQLIGQDIAKAVQIVTYDGRTLSNEYIKETYKKDKLIILQDTTTTNIYDEYGNLIKEVKTGQNMTESIECEYIYDDSNPSLKERLTKIKENNNVMEITYNKDFTTNEIINKYNNQKINKVKYKYDKLGKLTNLMFYDRYDKLINNNAVSYKNNNVNKLTDNSEVVYGMIYNGLNEPCELYKNGKLLEKSKTKKTKEIDSTTSIRYQNGITYQIQDNINKHKKLTSCKVTLKKGDEVQAEKETIYEYENAHTPTYFDKLTKVVDPYTNKTYNFTYNEDITGILKETMRCSDNYLIESNQSNEKTYTIPSDKRKVRLIVEPIDALNNNPKNSYNYVKKDNDEEEQQITYYSYDYEYDNLGRVIKKKTITDEYRDAKINIDKVLSYYTSTTLPRTITYNVTSTIDDAKTDVAIKYTNTYKRGNITKVEEEGNRFISNPKNTSSLDTASIPKTTTLYEYDDINRLKKETRPDGKVYTYIYGQSGMIEQVKKH